MASPSPDPEERIRLTITVTPKVHEVFSRLSAASSQSLGRTMGEWLEDTIDAAEYTAGMVERARQAPRVVAREVHAYALGLADETGALLSKLRKEGSATTAEATRPTLPPRPVIRGGKSPGKARRR
jgi:hypothetical protein